MMSDPLNIPVTRHELLRLRTLILREPVAIQNWGHFAYHLLQKPDSRLMIKQQLNDYEFSAAVLTTLEAWKASEGRHATLSCFTDHLRKHHLNNLAENVQKEFSAKEPEGVLLPNYRTNFATRENFKDEIRSALPIIREQVVNISNLLIRLLSEGVITVDEMEMVQSRATSLDKLSQLTLLFNSKRPSDWYKFKIALLETGNEHVVLRIDQLFDFQNSKPATEDTHKCRTSGAINRAVVPTTGLSSGSGGKNAVKVGQSTSQKMSLI